MKLAALSIVILLAAAFVLPASAETYVLQNGEKIEGSILRTGNGKVTIKTKSGVSSFGVLQFSDETRDAYFPDLEPAPEPKPVKSSARATPGRIPAPGATGPGETMPKASLGLVIAGGVLCLIGSLWFIIAGFAESVGWGIALILFNGIAGLAFLILHWDRAKSPVLTYLFGLALIIVAMLIGQ